MTFSRFIAFPFFLIILALFAQSTKAEDYNFQTFNLSDGVSNSTISNLYQDSNGYLWVGTARGVDLFTGKYFIPLKQFINDSVHTTSVTVNAIIEYPKNDIWVGTWGDGLFHVDIETGEYQHFKADTVLSSKTISDNYINCFHNGIDDQLWIGTIYGLCSYDTTGHFENYVFSEVLQKGYADIRAIIPQYDNLLTVFTHAGEIIELNTASGSYKRVGSLPEALTGITCVHQDKEQNYWIGTAHHGIYWLDRNFSLQKIPEAIHNLLGNTEISTIINDLSGNILLATDGKGIVRFSPSDFSYKQYCHSPFLPHSLANNHIQDALIDQYGNLWTAHFKAGLSKTNIKSDGISHQYRKTYRNDQLANNIINCFAEQPNSNHLWVGTEEGITLWDKTSKDFIEGSPFIQSVIKKVGPNPITALKTDTSNNTIWVGTFNKGFFKIALSEKRITNYNKDNSNLESNFIRDFAPIGADEYLIACVDGGLFKYTKGTITKINVYHQNGFELRNFFHIQYVDSANTWLSTAGGGLVLLNATRHTGQMFPSIITETAYTSLLSVDSVLYAGTNKGAFRYNPEKNDFEPLHYISRETEVYGIIEDQYHYIWFSTSNGLFRLDPSSHTWGKVNSPNLQGNEFQPGSYLQLQDGRLAFGGINGFNIVDPTRYSFTPANQNIFIGELQFFNNKIKIGQKFGNHTIISKQINFVDQVFIPHDVDLFNLTPYNINYQYLDPGKFAYSITQKNKPGKIITTENIISFHNLQPGHYQLNIYPVNPFTLKAERTGGKSLTIIKATPWWRSTAFILAIIFSSLIVVFTLYRIRTLNQQRVLRQLEEMVRVKTMDLIKKKEELTHQRDELQKTLNQNIKLENFKEALISMIVHDLKNPLNGIIGLSSLNEPEYLERIHSVSQQMLYMVENILDVRKYENHSLKIFHQPTDIREIVEEAIADVNFLLTDNQIQIINRMESIVISFDRDIIKRVYVNLLTNAIKFSPDKGAITLEGKYQTFDNQKKLVLSIKDQGKGIPEEFHDDIFDLYKQVKIKKSGKATSTGLGLSFCKIAVEAHKGKIWVESAPDQGSTFIFSLPT